MILFQIYGALVLGYGITMAALFVVACFESPGP